MTTEVPIENSGLYQRLSEDQELLQTLLSLRKIVKSLAATIQRSAPSFTDHTVRHMDSLWIVTDKILTPQEMQRLTTGEAFLLSTSFYLHDIGMAYAANDESISKCKESQIFKSVINKFPEAKRTDKDIENRALEYTVRIMHANAALELATNPFPGTDIYLFESNIIRGQWGDTCGKIAASHHWDIEKIQTEFGVCEVSPLPGNRKGDLAYVACILRLVDYAHINRDRASSIDRAFRTALPADSLIHWLAQENIDGPERSNNELIYRSSRAISNVDAWWLYYYMLSGLDAEIRCVYRFIEQHCGLTNRFSLQSVRGASSPREAVKFIPTDGFLPIEVNLRTGSIDKLVNLLAGESLYGPDPMAAVRELIQNARDAVMLKKTIAKADEEKAIASLPIKIIFINKSDGATLEVKDYGIGMTPKIITEYLISIASDYWNTEFFEDFPGAIDTGFQPAGKFGIGFLSVFMLGDNITIETNRSGKERVQLTLNGLAKRGELRKLASVAGSGTSIKIQLKDSTQKSLGNLYELVRHYAPMIPHKIELTINDDTRKIEQNWIFALTEEDFLSWVYSAVDSIRINTHQSLKNSIEPRIFYPFMERQRDIAKVKWPNTRPVYVDSKTRLIASFGSVSILCSKGLALQPIKTPGLVGILDLDSVVPDASRRQAVKSNIDDILSSIVKSMQPAIIDNINSLSGFAGEYLEFLSLCVNCYGEEVVKNSHVRWINFLKLPGEIELLSCSAFLDKCSSCDSIFLAYDTGPWGAMKLWSRQSPERRPNEIVIVQDDIGYPSPGYARGDETIIGTLSSLWDTCVSNIMFRMILNIISAGWQMSIENLTAQEGWQHKGSVLWGRFLKQ